VPIWQEDVLRLMKRVGLSPDDRNAILKAVKMSNDRTVIAQRTFARVHPIFIQCAIDNLGVDEAAGERMWATIMEFQEYGFARSHGTAYGLLSYRMAWLKVHHPTEFHWALLSTWEGLKKEPAYIAEAQRVGMTIHRPHINRSGAGWTLESEGHLRKGFRSIPGVGEAGALELANCAPYESLDDLCERVSGRAVPGAKKYLAKKTRGEFGGVLTALRDSGALAPLMEG
jgi:DNA polymerase-3 subunit alpha